MNKFSVGQKVKRDSTKYMYLKNPEAIYIIKSVVTNGRNPYYWFVEIGYVPETHLIPVYEKPITLAEFLGD